MLGFGPPHLVWVKRDHDNPAATGTSNDAGIEPLNAHDPIVIRREPGQAPGSGNPVAVRTSESCLRSGAAA